MDKEISYVSDFCASILSRGELKCVLNKMIFLIIFSWSCGAWSHFRNKKDTFFVEKKNMPLNENLIHLKQTSY